MELNEYLSAARARRVKRRSLWRIVFFIIVFAALAAGAGWLAARSPFVRVNAIVVRGASSVADDRVVAVASAAFAESHGVLTFLGMQNMLAWPSLIPTSALALEPRLASATLTKDYGAHVIVVTVTEREPFAIWCVIPGGVAGDLSAGSFDETCSWFDTAGVLFAQTFDTEGAMLFAIHDYSDPQLNLGSTILPARFIGNMFSILDVLHASGLRIKEVRLNDLGLEEIQVKTYEGPDILFSLRFPAGDTLAVLQNVIGKPGFNKLQYVDFRTQNRAYYK
jgi:hypothetical protein